MKTPENTPPGTSRRQFLRQFSAVVVTSPFLSRRLLAAAPSEVVHHASFGASGMAWADLNAIAQHPAVKLVAVADVDLSRTGAVREKFPDARIYQDWRELLDKEKALDSVNVSTPDHMHGPIAMAALQLGKHVYCEKPLTHDIYESRRLTEVAREKRRVTQMGIQIHSNAEYRMAVRLVQDGVIGKIKEVHTWSNKKWGDSGPMPDRSDPVPEGLDWNLWLGVCAERPFIGDGWYHPSNWRKRLDFGTGTFGDMGCHIYDPVFKALALTAPISVRSEGPAPNSHSWATDAVIHYVFPGTPYTEGTTVRITWYDGDQRPPAEIRDQAGIAVSRGRDSTAESPARRLPDQGSVFVGTKGFMLLPHVGWPVLFPEAQFKGFQMPDVGSADHWLQFVDAILGKGATSTTFDYSGPLTETVLLGSVVTRFPRTTLAWDAAQLKFTNLADANRYVRRAYRRGWKVEGL